MDAFVNKKESGFGWRKARRCSADSCVEVRREGNGLFIRDSKENSFGIHQPIIALSIDEWDSFTADLLDGEDQRPEATTIERSADGEVTLSHGATALTFDADEWRAFESGLADGDFG